MTPKLSLQGKTETYIPGTNENMYEIGWGARAKIWFPLARKEGGKDLYRTLKIFDRLDMAHRVGIENAPATSTGTLAYTGRVSIEKIEALTTGGYVEELNASRDGIFKRNFRRVLAGLDQRPLFDEWLTKIALNGFDAIVELGAGYGRNLFEIYYRGGPTKARYMAAEYTRSGRDLTEKFLKLNPKIPLKTAFFDHRKPDVSFIKKARRVLFFSNHSIEQVDRIPADYFDVLMGAAPEVVGIHLEPFGLQYPPQWEHSPTHESYISSNKYNRNLLETLKATERRGKLKIRGLIPDLIDPRPGNPTSIVLWDNLKTAGIG